MCAPPNVYTYICTDGLRATLFSNVISSVVSENRLRLIFRDVFLIECINRSLYALRILTEIYQRTVNFQQHLFHPHNMLKYQQNVDVKEREALLETTIRHSFGMRPIINSPLKLEQVINPFIGFVLIELFQGKQNLIYIDLRFNI